MDTPKIYVACLASYNNGILHSKWVEAAQDVNDIFDEIQEMLAKSPIENAEEFAIHDYEGFGNVGLSEFESIETVVELACFITEHGELGAALLGDYSVEEAGRLLKENYYGAYESEVDFAYEVIEEYYSNALPENLMSYFDYVAFLRVIYSLMIIFR